MSTIERLNANFRVVSDAETLHVRPDITATSIDGWAVLSQINRITTVKMKFLIGFQRKALLKQRKLGSLLADLERNPSAAS